MTKDEEDTLVGEFPTVLKGLICADVDVGWNSLIRELCAELEPLVIKIKSESVECECGDNLSHHVDNFCSGKHIQIFTGQELVCRCPGFSPLYPYIYQLIDYSGLEIYSRDMGSNRPELHRILKSFRKKSKRICEFCGGRGRVRSELSIVSCLWCLSGRP